MRINDLSARSRPVARTATVTFPAARPVTKICSCTQCQQRRQLATQLQLIVLSLLGSLLCLALMPKSIDAVALPISAQQGVFDCAAVTEIPQTECEALVALYNSTNGPGWADSTGWLATMTPCSWVGVGCVAGHVQRLTLINQQMIGSLPTSMGNLSNLEILELYQNQLSGPIPAEIGNLLNLRELALSGNQLNGPIPLALANLTSLEQITLSGNQLTGTVPIEFGALTNLQSLALGGNQLHGEIPAELGNLTALISLRLQNNQLSGAIPSWLGNLTNLQYLFLNGNQLSGTLPAALGNLTNLQWLHLYANQLNGSLPLNLVQLTNITNFDFHNTNLCEPTATTFQTWLAGIANVQRTNIPCPNPDQLLSVHLLAFDNHAGNIDTNLTPSYPAVVGGALAATQDVLTKTVALLVDLDGVGDTHVVIIRNGTVVHLLGEDDLNLHLVQKFAGWQLPIAPETTVEALLPAGDGTLTAPAVFEYDMADGVQLGVFLQWLFNTYIEDAAATQTLLSYVGHGAAVVPADDVAAAIGVTTCDDVEYGQPAGNTGIIALPGGSLGAHPAFTDCHGQPNSTGDYRPTLLAPRSLADAISTALASSPVAQMDV
ncbi:MAG: leucine-rich repeat domain-containing protein, partial [Caldilineaceae bacterium]|nr:leucine-rich repeat domain-containing protein [Caldilineaceae bacterium]